MVPIQEAIASGQWRKVWVVCGTQMGKTAGLLNVMGRELDDHPAPMLYVGPTKNNVSTVIEPQITSMLRGVPSLWMKTDRSRKAQRLAKTVAGVSLRLAWAGSPTELASQPAKIVLVDEYDRMDPIPGEGDVMTLAEARNANYRGGLTLGTSSPTEGNVDVAKHPETGIEHWAPADPKDLESPIWRLWQEGTRHEWAVPCPQCTEYFVPRLRLLWWPRDSKGRSCAPRIARREAKLMCPNCGAMIDEADKEAMNAGGVYLAPGQRVVDGKVSGEAPDSDAASFWISGLMSPWRSFGDRAAQYLTAIGSGDQEKIRAAINTGLGELYAFRGDAPPSESVRSCSGAYKSGEVPDRVRWLTAGVDVQKTRLVYVVRGWGYSMESWLIECGEIWGDTAERPVWAELDELLAKDYGRELRIRRMGIDSGYRPGDKWRRPENMIYEFCSRSRRAVPTKGHDRQNRPLHPSFIDVTLRGQTYKRGLQLWHIDSDFFKSWVHARLSWPTDQAGRFWVPQDVSEDYCMQLTAETRVPKPSGAAVWVKIRPDNHYLDAEAIAVAVAQSLGVHRKVPKKGEKEEAEDSAVTAEGTTDQPPATPQPKPAPVRRGPGYAPRRNWINRW